MKKNTLKFNNFSQGKTAYLFSFALFIFALLPLSSEKFSVELWKGIKDVKEPGQTVLFGSRPKNQNDTAVIICPGGSYHHLGMYNEGHKSAVWFNSLGVTTFVLRYRVAEGGCNHPCQLEDIQRAVQYVRSHADEYGISPHKIGAIGYSAGGHLVLMAGAFAGTMNELIKLGINATEDDIRPDFVMPIYPVVSMRDDIANIWSRKSLLGKNMSDERKAQFSMERQIPQNMPPCYVLACHDDPTVQFENSVILCDALKEKNISYKFAVYDKGGHGFGMLNNKFMKQTKWNEDLQKWLSEQGFIPQQ